jgi:alpha/beta superfamily hydrolase
VKEESLFIQSTYKLEAILAEPDALTSQAFLLLSGSGPGDLDGNYKALKMNLYKGISDYLVQQGFATLRYNKRGIGNSEGDYDVTGLYDFLEDVDAAVQYLRDTYDKVYLIGHSEGAMLATLYQASHTIDGMVLISGAGTALRSALNYQQQCTLDEIKRLPGLKGTLLRLLIKEEKLWKQQHKFYKKIESSTKDVVRIQLVAKIQAKWMREHLLLTDEHFLNILQDVNVPTLVIGGTKDVQANVKDIDTIETLENPSITTKQIINMTHMLRLHEKEKSMLNLKKQYKGEMKQPLTTELFDTITEWLKTLKK